MSAMFHDWWMAHRLEVYLSCALFGLLIIGASIVWIVDLFRRKP